MATTKSGIETPLTPPNKSLGAPTKVYEGSKNIGQGAKGSNIIVGPGQKNK
jgi:hypothetical protein